MSELLSRLAARAANLETRTDEWPDRATLGQLLTVAEFERSFTRLGFKPPSLLVEAFETIGNGGFGPGYGLIGLEGGIENEDGNTAVDLYCVLKAPSEEEPAWEWPDKLLPLGNWGCAMYTCLDCSDDAMRLSHWEPNIMELNMDPRQAIFDMQMTLADWFERWVEGDNLWNVVERAMSSGSAY